MSLLVVGPEFLASAAADLKGIGAELNAAHAAAAGPTTGLLAAGADEVSTAVASLFSGHSQAFQAIGAQASTFHAQFVQALSGAGGAYAAAEAANASPLQAAEQAAAGVQWFSPWESLTGRPLVGNGANGAAGTGQAGGDGGWIFGNGGNGGSGASGQAGGAGGAGGELVGNGGNGGAGGPMRPVGPEASPASCSATTGPAGNPGPRWGPAGCRCRCSKAPSRWWTSPWAADRACPCWWTPDPRVWSSPSETSGCTTSACPPGSVRARTAGELTYWLHHVRHDGELRKWHRLLDARRRRRLRASRHCSATSPAATVPPGSWVSGSNAGGPGPPSSPVNGLPGTINQGVLINEPKGYLQFANSNPLPACELD